jgi:hypothetical protein
VRRLGYETPPEKYFRANAESQPSNSLYQPGNKAGRKPPLDKLTQYPKVKEWFDLMMGYYADINNLGYADIPKDAYQAWLQTVNEEKRKQESLEAKNSLKQSLNK